jgi:hypothetical protein
MTKNQSGLNPSLIYLYFITWTPPTTMDTARASVHLQNAAIWASAMMRRPTQVAFEDRPALHQLLTTLAAMEDPIPALEVKVDSVGHVYDVTLRGFTAQIHIPTLVTKLKATERHALLKGVTKVWAQLGLKDILIGVQLRGQQGVVAGGSIPRQVSQELRVSAMEWSTDLVRSLQTKEEDRQWVEAALTEALLFEQPQPKLDVVLAHVGDNYNIQLCGYKGALDMCAWANAFLGVGRDPMMTRIQHSFMQVVPEKGACIILQMTKAEFQMAPISIVGIPEDDSAPQQQQHQERGGGRPRAHSRPPSRARSKSHRSEHAPPPPPDRAHSRKRYE